MLENNLDSIDSVSDEFKAFYEEKDGKYVLNASGEKIVSEFDSLKSGMASAKDHERGERKKIAEENRLMREQLDSILAKQKEAEEENFRKSANKDDIIKSLDEKISALEASSADSVKAVEDQYQAIIRESKVDSVANALASELAVQGSSVALLPHIQQRLSMEVLKGESGKLEFRTVVLDKSGKPSAMTVEDLKADVQSDPAYAPILVGSKASGSGANGGSSGSGASNNQGNKNLSDMSRQERVAEINRRAEAKRQEG